MISTGISNFRPKIVGFMKKNTARKPLRSLYTVSSKIYVLEGGQLSRSTNIMFNTTRLNHVISC